MQLTFLGTRGNLEIATPHHRSHSALLVEHGGVRLLLDCGRDWRDHAVARDCSAILLTHAHDDHAGGLVRPFAVPVHATAATWEKLAELAGDPLARDCEPGQVVHLGGLVGTPLPVGHSLRAPAVGWRLEAGGRRIFYAPDVAALPDAEQTLAGADLYIGDGSAFDGSLERIEAGSPCGHAAIGRQLEWCRRSRVPVALLTHCGSQVLEDESRANARLADLATRAGIEARFASDGLVLTL